MGNSIAAREEFGTANRHEPLLTEGNGIKTRPVPITMADRRSTCSAIRSTGLVVSGNTEINLWVGRSKASKPVQQEPFRTEVRRGRTVKMLEGLL